MRRRFLKTRALIIYLAVVGILLLGAYYSPILLRSSLESYLPLDIQVTAPHSLTGTDVGPDARSAGTTKPQSGRVVLIVVNGLGDDDFRGLPALKRLKEGENGATISAGARLFSGSVPAVTPGLVTLLTGASPEITGGYNLDYPSPTTTSPSPAYQLEQVDNLFAASLRSNNTTAFFGSAQWQSALKPEWGYQAAFPVEQPSNDVADAVLNFLKKKSANFTLVQLSAMGYAANAFSSNSPEFSQARESLNTALIRLTSDDQIDLSRTTVLITGDWDTLIKAGDRWAIPLLMVGQAVQPGDWIWGKQEDVTSTIAALLGIEMPRQNMGRILTGMLSIPPVDMAEKLLALVDQRQNLSRAYRARLGLPLPIAVNEPLAVDAEKSVKVASQDYRLGLYDDIEGVIDPVLRYTRNDMGQAREEWYAQARLQRGVLSLVLVLIPLGYFFYRRSLLLWLAFGAALAASALPYLFYAFQGRSFSFNTARLEALRDSSIWRAGFSLLVALVLLALAFDWVERRQQKLVGRVDLDYTVITGLRKAPFPVARLFMACVYLLGGLLYFSAWVWWAWYYWRTGIFGPFGQTNPPLPPDLSSSFLQFMSLNHTTGFLIWMLFAPAIFIVIFWLKRRLLGEGSSEEESHDILAKSRARSTGKDIIKT
ncbi:MAG: hypothetical protein HXX08_10785 [Chloroflexi bacterium]|uniref:Alkaline phosphatase family protein n=1 Tax=Candidatus Chlorohelix allophototropha TaxID=3003348 RepID=A0A8T7M0P8_9CHLR|nr:hypothetical protein [Chloroflexota bacterium]WJW65723.1 hypothetical protein OZ401_001501 [Chloroflexota bacterium L227-S17]